MAEAEEPTIPAAAAGEPLPTDGVLVHRRDDGSLAEEVPLANGIIDGEVKSYTPEGWLQRVAHFKAGRLHGQTVEFDADGSVVGRFTFADGRLSGPAAVYVNGRLSQQMNFADGVLAGEMRSYDAAGDLAALSHFARGQLDGEATALRPDGSPIRVARYREGKLEGETVDYWENGKIRQRAQYKNDAQDGPTTTYLITGELEQQIIYENGKPVAAKPAARPQNAPPRPAGWLDRLTGGS
jgi:antitoxin component YwqK of YwqJK toxin-antitoxin module